MHVGACVSKCTGELAMVLSSPGAQQGHVKRSRAEHAPAPDLPG